ncbi:Rid family hydrolase [Pusillimonas sp. T7-7]|uniref:Rid family hydrolase n=1 Tax=Pusillimonas sp. (strain T7-7) TaxID=1007105 RepID=UPI00130525BC|nr:Rid family hydrolase [Pusillimonas sp. T7-7]
MNGSFYLENTNSTAPVCRAVGISNNATFYQLGAQYPEVTDPSAPPKSVQAFGNTYTQTTTTLQRLSSILADLKLAKRNLTHMRVYLVAESAGGRMDIDGFNKAYTEYFQDQDRNYPSRTVIQVAAMVNPGWLIEIEATAAK